MNAHEQKSHRTVTLELRKGVEAVAEASAQRFARLERDIELLRGQLRDAEIRLRERVIDEAGILRQITNDDRDRATAQLALTHDFMLGFVGLGFWARLSWLLTGRR